MTRLTACIDMMDEGIGRVKAVVPELPAADVVLTRLLLMVSGCLQEEVERKLKPYKLNDSDFRTLVILFSRADGSSTPGELCDFTAQGATNMTRITNALVKRGLITRGTSAEDRRRVVIRITPDGRRFVRKMLPPMFPRVSAAYIGFSDADKRNLDRLLRKVAVNLDQLNADVQS
ncbi:MarR family winged helix-turn-helix transcriptional regulator [Dyella tabacisoli]|uniref:MarR family transcriptional regulator n=1 Tax=Dyella tabacisoli TaxID=2282381 RepID=A0A369UM03_9GAMM|nr:MarR family transcriptional regulator [Dyella tabacisoli]RDD81115.1 MarR family transcriptional regulator [Dyella tabacisoli]